MKKRYWIAAIAALGIADIYAAHVKHEGTLSQAGREIFQTDTPLGKAVWVASWGALSAWLIPHIWNWPEDIKDIIETIS